MKQIALANEVVKSLLKKDGSNIPKAFNTLLIMQEELIQQHEYDKKQLQNEINRLQKLLSETNSALAKVAN